jgi:DNA-binding NarL/FixJ family response regulator
VRPIRAAVVDEHEIFRRGLLSCLADDPFVEVVWESAQEAPAVEVDVAVVSLDAAGRDRYECPLVVLSPVAVVAARLRDGASASAILPRRLLSSEQLSAAVRAAAVGLQVNRGESAPEGWERDDRHVEVLRLLAQGAGTHDIAASLSYSERTIKSVIQEIERELGARSRAHAVAEGIRRGLI